MRINFKSLVLAPMALAIAAFAAQPAVAATQAHLVNIPFSFVAAGKTCPAGAYHVYENNYGGTLVLNGADSGFSWILVPTAANIGDQSVVLTFDVTGQGYLLRNVRIGAMTTPRIDKMRKEHIPAAQQIALLGQ